MFINYINSKRELKIMKFVMISCHHIWSLW